MKSTSLQIQILMVTLFSVFAFWGCDEWLTFDKPEVKVKGLQYAIAAGDSSIQAQPFSIQVAALTSEPNAEALVTSLERARFPVFVVTRPGQAVHELLRVRVGPYASEREASRQLLNLREMGYEEAFVKNHVSETEAASEIRTFSAADLPDNQKRLTTGDNCSHPRWSPTGREIAFIRDFEGVKGLYSVGTGGGKLSKIMDRGPSFRLTGEFEWSPDGTKLAFATREMDAKFDAAENLYVVGKDGAGLRRLYRQRGFGFHIKSISWSPDGRHLAFDADDSNGDGFATPIRISQVLEVANAIPLRTGNLDKQQWTAGWASNNTVIFVEKKSGGPREKISYVLKRFEAATGHEARVGATGSIGECVSVRLLPGGLLVFSVLADSQPGAARVVFHRVVSGGSFVLYETLPETGPISPLQVSSEGLVFFAHENQLWLNGVAGQKSIVDMSFPLTDFTVSATGSRLCYVRDGNLFAFKLPDQ